jgi:hypothetical protein
MALSTILCVGGMSVLHCLTVDQSFGKLEFPELLMAVTRVSSLMSECHSSRRSLVDSIRVSIMRNEPGVVLTSEKTDRIFNESMQVELEIFLCKWKCACDVI